MFGLSLKLGEAGRECVLESPLALTKLVEPDRAPHLCGGERRPFICFHTQGLHLPQTFRSGYILEG